MKGDAPETFTIDGVSLAYGGSLDDFEHHYSDAFWKDVGGCSFHLQRTVIYPSFAARGIFLIFVEAPFHRKSYECIIRTHGGEGVRDKWLTWVETNEDRTKRWWTTGYPLRVEMTFVTTTLTLLRSGVPKEPVPHLDARPEK